MKAAFEFSHSLHRQLDLYALAASAAGVGALALAHPAQAKIIYTPANTSIVNGTPLDLNHDHQADFRFATNTWHITSTFSFGLSVLAVGKNRIWGTSVYTCRTTCKRVGYASALGAGARIGPNKKKLQRGNDRMGRWMQGIPGSTFSGGPWAKVQDGYLGLKFLIDGKAHYGWARIHIKDTWKGGVTLTGYAYETIPNKAIIMGKTKGPDVITVQPDIARGSLGGLALGRK
jgi:hypothetical protein